jgi:hypothetical protein
MTKLRVIADEIVSDEGYVIARFDPQLPPSRRDRAEALLMETAVETDWDLRERCFEQQDTIEVLHGRIRDLEIELEELRVVQ